MNIYSKKQVWKASLLFGGLIIALASLFYTNSIVNKLAIEESKKIELVAEATQGLANINDNQQDISFLLRVITDNETVPVICVDENDVVMSWRNLDSAAVKGSPEFLQVKLQEMKAIHAPIVIPIADGEKQYIYFENSILIDLLSYYPLMQLSIIGLFIVISYFAFSSSRNAEQNQVWVGMSKETAHQLGTPLSSLIGWVEYLKIIGVEQSIVCELEKDVKRLETITDRFSKIGSKPVFDQVDLTFTVNTIVNYLRSRISNKVNVFVKADGPIEADICVPLFEWVIENITKNAVDAMEGNGTITIDLNKSDGHVFIDITDTGIGITKTQFSKVFKPGYTTKKRGWGLGLSLVKRIVEEYHNGKIYVKHSEIGKGTTFRIEL
jgi:two-component system, sporulation sensor kinase D